MVLKSSNSLYTYLKKGYFCAMFMKTKIFLTGLVTVIILSACGEYNKILKSTDYEYRYKKAIEYYEAGEYVKAGTLFQELVNIYRGTSRADQIYYYYAISMMGQKDYLLATHYFKSLLKEFPGSQYAEEAQFMTGYCSYLLSPNSRLDQTVTKEGIESLQLYINLYPYSDRVAEANRLIDELKAKLMHKSYLNARLYYDFENYKAAVIALGNSLQEYPETPNREELMYMLLKSKYLLAINSVADKKPERLSNALDEYFSFVDEFPDSQYRKEVDRFYEMLADLLDYNELQETNIY